MTVRVAVGIGSNLGDRFRHVVDAATAIGRLGNLYAVSSVYETAAVGGPVQGPYLNAVAVVDTDLSGREVLDQCLAIERAHGRERDERWGPRTLDLDIILYGSESLNEDGLTVPHSRLEERRFVLEPLLEVMPDATLPDGRRLSGLLRDVASQSVAMVGSLADAEEGLAASGGTLHLTFVGPGRAGLSIALAASASGHIVDAVVGRTGRSAEPGAELVGASPLGLHDPLPKSDLIFITTRDDAIGQVAEALALRAEDGSGRGVVHVSGLVGLAVLDPLAECGFMTGSFHPLQTLPTPQAGAARLEGAYIAITAAGLRHQLFGVASSLGAIPFDIGEDAKALYHAAAAAAANFPLGSLAMARDLLESAGVPFVAARPLVEAVVANAFELGPRAALTGPVARGDVDTVLAQITAVASAYPSWLDQFIQSVGAIAALGGSGPQFAEAVAGWFQAEGQE